MMKTDAEFQVDAVRVIAPEDIRPEMYLAVLHVVGEHLPFFNASDVALRTLSPLRLHWLPWGNNTPMKVVDVCLPFVLVKQPDGKHRTLDVRRYRFARLSDRFGRRAFKRSKSGRTRCEEPC